MGLFFWKNNRKIDNFAQAVADDLFSYVQPDVAHQHVLGRGDVSRKKKAKIDQKFTDIRLQIKRFSETNSLGVYGKARLMKQFNDRLEELGYDVEIVNKITENFLISNA
ncbi:MAG: hypothetical protein QNI96_10395 [Woeseiaceae bacterium]|nr:hypothetical protein [Woeseiaceae bacterium]